MGRITSNYEPGQKGGNEGYSEIFHGARLSKGTPYIDIYNKTELVVFMLSLYLDEEKPNLAQVDLDFFVWLRKSLFSLNSFVYGVGMEEWTEKHLPDIKSIEYMKTRIEKIKIEKGDFKSEFIYYGSTLNAIRIRIRELECSFWRFRDFVMDKMALVSNLKLEAVTSRFNKMGEFLNLLSYYIYWLEVVDEHPQWEPTSLSNFELTL
jgi:hypothetical protein